MKEVSLKDLESIAKEVGLSEFPQEIGPGLYQLSDKGPITGKEGMEKFMSLSFDPGFGKDFSAYEPLFDSVIENLIKQQEESVEYILRNFVVPPIKGEITKGKIRWRGLSLVNCEGVCIGVKQRDVLITRDGKRISFKNGKIGGLTVRRYFKGEPHGGMSLTVEVSIGGSGVG